MRSTVFLLATYDTKAPAVDHLTQGLVARGFRAELIDLSLGSKGSVWPSERKLDVMRQKRDDALSSITQMLKTRGAAVLAIGGGTGGELALSVLEQLPLSMPKALLTTLPFDPRPSLARNRIVLIPSMADIEGINVVLKSALDLAIDTTVGLAHRPWRDEPAKSSVGLSTLGATQGAANAILQQLDSSGFEVTSFHANGYGGASLARFAAEGALTAVIDLTVHEITRLKIKGACVEMPDRFSSAPDVPRVVLPGGLTFLGLGAIDELSCDLLKRPHYQHSSLFTHVLMTEQEVEIATCALADELNKLHAPCSFILPMGGFSHEDRPGGAIEAPHLRQLAADILTRHATGYTVHTLPNHIADKQVAQLVSQCLVTNLQRDS